MQSESEAYPSGPRKRSEARAGLVPSVFLLVWFGAGRIGRGCPGWRTLVRESRPPRDLVDDRRPVRRQGKTHPGPQSGLRIAVVRHLQGDGEVGRLLLCESVLFKERAVAAD